jgi:hypothetical protein
VTLDPGQKRTISTLPKTAQIAGLMTKLGPDIPTISRRLGIQKETARYQYKDLIIRKGFALQAMVNHEGLGLRRVVMKAKVNAQYEPYAREMFFAMNEFCYVVSFSSLLPDAAYMLHANVPVEHKEDFIDFMSRLKEIGLFDSIEFYTFDWFRNIPMRVEFYDFDRGIWDFDWTNPVKLTRDEVEIQTPELEFDQIDLLILKEMYVDATSSLLELRDAINTNDGIDINYKTLWRHWVMHVQGRKMINGYKINWIGTKYDFVADKAKQRQHRYVLIALFVKGISQAERGSLISEMNRLPFLWCEAAGDDYHAQIAFPVVMVNEAFSFLMKIMSPYGSRASYSIIDQTNALTFTMSYRLYNSYENGWNFEPENLLAKFESLSLKISATRDGPKLAD